MNKTVSIIIPCYNEEKTIQQLLAGFLAQSYPRHLMEVLIADGLSTDGTRREIAAFAQRSQGLFESWFWTIQSESSLPH